MLSQKCQYALRALVELARRYGSGPVRIAQVAQSQAIPPRFLEVILSQLKRGGFVESRRGREGGYVLARPPCSIRVGEVIRFVDGPIGPVRCVAEGGEQGCPLGPGCAFIGLWRRAREALSKVYDETTLEDLVREERLRRARFVPSYTI